MSSLFDALLNRPMAEVVVRLLLFILFALHFLFVLFTIGTALQSVFYFIRYRWGRTSHTPDGDQPMKSNPLPTNQTGRSMIRTLPNTDQEMPTSEPLPTSAVAAHEKEYAWGKQILYSFLGVKSLAVAFGVGALLLIELGLTVPFFTAINLLAPYWLLIIVFLIIAFLTLDLIGQNWDIRPYLHLGMGMVGLLFLLAVPGVFVAVLTTMEHPEYWQAIINNNYRLPGVLSLHWLFRYVHVIGASLVFGGALHYFLSSADQRQKRAEMLRWVVAGILVQFVLGILLYASLPRRPDMLINLLIVVAVTAAGILVWTVTFRQSMPMHATVPLLLFVLLPMLLTRQALQDQGTLAFNVQLEQNAAVYRETIAQYSPQALQAYEANLNMRYDSGEAIYARSCAFCHGEQANGQGQEASKLTVPPEVLAAVRADRGYLDQLLRAGVLGTGMPYFTFLISSQVDALFGYLNSQYQMLEKPQPAQGQAIQTDVQKATGVYYGTCSNCHGGDGRAGTIFSKGFAPPPPDLTRYSLTPQRSFEVITNGYPGTLMVPFNNLPEDVRWGLVQVVEGFRK